MLLSICQRTKVISLVAAGYAGDMPEELALVNEEELMRGKM
jgi:hypothetical protein